MERFYFSYNWVWLRWERREKTGPVPTNLPQRCPYVSLSDYPSGGGENWRMIDCRMWTNIRIREWQKHRANRLALKEEQGIA